MVLGAAAARSRRRACWLALAAWLCVHCGGGDPIERARAYQSAGHLDDALAALRPLIDQHSRDPEVLYLYGTTLRRQGKPSQALWALREASRMPGWEISAGLELGAAALEARNFHVGIEAASAVLEREPDNVLALAMRAEARLEDRSDYEASLADFDRALELAPDDLRLRVSRLANLLLLGRIEEAGAGIAELEVLADDAFLRDGELARFCIAQAMFARERAQSEERGAEAADADFAACLERYPDQPMVVASAVEHYDESERFERGNELLADFIAREPGAFQQRSLLARRLRSLGSLAAAEALLREGTEQKGIAAAHAWTGLAEHFIAQSEYAAAAEAFGRARALEGDMGPQRILVHAELYAMAQQNERALEIAAELGDHFYRDMVYAWVRSNERRPREALEHLEAVLVQWPDNAGAHYHAARAAERIGDWPRAIDGYRNSIRAGAAETDAGVRLAKLYRAEGRLQEASVALMHHLKEHADDIPAALLAVELAAELANAQQLQGALARVPRTAAAQIAATLAEVRARRQGAEAAVGLLRRDEKLDFTSPRDTPAIAALVRNLRVAGRAGEGLAVADAALAAHPEVARLHEIRASLLEGEAAEQALARALELDPALEPAVLALAALRAGAGDADGALALLDRLREPSPEGALEKARLLAALARPADAASLLEDLLWEWPHHAEAAMALAELRLRDGAGSDDWTLGLARTAVRFGAGPRAYALLARVHAARGEEALAAEAREKASQAS